jgi:signal transduction histidine kinase
MKAIQYQSFGDYSENRLVVLPQPSLKDGEGERKRAQAGLSCEVVFREQLMGILGHELRNPLSAVLGFAEMLRSDATLSPEVKENLGMIRLAATRMSEMIETILDFTSIRFSEGGLPISRAEMNLGELCRQLVEEALAAHPGRLIPVETRGDLSGRWDGARLGQVVSNLVENALAHGDEKQPVKLIAQGAATVVTLEVVNRGPTIAADEVATLFEPFVRGAGTDRGRARRGLGLGLYIAKQIVASHGGTLTARSADGTTTFTVALPRLP